MKIIRGKNGKMTLAAEDTADPKITGTSPEELWNEAVQALVRCDAAEFLSEEYMAESRTAQDLFEQAAVGFSEAGNTEMATEAAQVVARLARFNSLDWGDPADVETSDDPSLTEDDPLMASGAPVHPPAAWFQDPQLTAPTPLTITPEGRVYGHIATWGTCHTGIAHQCVTPPRSATNYAHFRTGALMTAEGAEISVGHLTFSTKHAHKSLNAQRAAAHYDHTGQVGADVAVGEDSIGIWFSGALRPGLSDEKVREFRAAPLSGDWRRLGGNLELVAALGVNMPGFPVPRPQGMVASGVMQTLVASGMVAPAEVREDMSDRDKRYLERLNSLRPARHAMTPEDEMLKSFKAARDEMAVRKFAEQLRKD